MTNGRYIDIENEVLRSRLADCKAGALSLIETVERYVQPKKGEFCHRTELIRVKDNLKKILQLWQVNQ